MGLFRKRKGSTPRHSTDVLERPEYGWIWKPLLALLVIYLLVAIGLGIWWSRPPSPFDVEQATAVQRGEASDDTTQAATTSAQRGAVATATLLTTLGTLLDKPGGYLRNDMMPPGLWLDNMPSWEYGVLRQARDLARSLPELAGEELDAFEEVDERLSANSKDWLYPSAERRFEQAVDVLEGYLQSLSEDAGPGFEASGDGASVWLSRVERRLDSLTHRLSASVGEREALRDLGVDDDALPDRTPWFRVDDIFFEARGSGWALIHLLEAMRRDLQDVIAAADADGLWDELIAELKLTQRRIWSPMILNGSGFGLFANHSLVMANHTARARELAGELTSRLEGVEAEQEPPSQQGEPEEQDVQGEQSEEPDDTTPESQDPGSQDPES